MSKTYFINNLDSYLGRAVVNKIVGPENPDAEPDKNIIGTRLDPEDNTKGRGIKKILKVLSPADKEKQASAVC